MTLGHFILDVKPVSLSGNKLYLQFNKEEDEKSFFYDIDHITRKAHKFFGKKLEFIAEKDTTSQISLSKRKVEKEETVEHELVNTGDEFVDLIINELGGEEIS